MLFMVLLLVVCVFVMTAAGHFPARFREQIFRTPSGAAILWGSIFIVGVSAIVAIAFAIQVLPWYAAVIGGGLMVLAAPLLVQPFPDRAVDSPQALLILAAVALALDVAASRFL